VRAWPRPAVAGSHRRCDRAGRDYDELVEQPPRLQPQVVVTRYPDAADVPGRGHRRGEEVRKRLPGTGIVILSQYDDPEYAIRLLAEGAAGYAYLLKDRVSDSDLLGKAIRAVATGGSMIDPQIVHELVSPTHDEGELSADEEDLLRQVAEGRRSRRSRPARLTPTKP